MYSLIRLGRHKLPALIAIFAILLLFVAPEVSKTLEHRRMENRNEHAVTDASEGMPYMHHMTGGSGQDMGIMGDMEMSGYDMSMHHKMSQHDNAVQAPMPGIPGMMHGDMMDDVACGYCVMLIHLPLMIWVFAAIIWLTLRISVTPPPRLILRHFTPFFPGIAQPRAPPVYLS
ncbi:DUF2946 domain-containing protein [Klebsiella aerogenes]|nr:DUF2946 domain-containing protein [Klebsiella aerogenes]